MKIKIDSDDNLPLNKTIEILILKTVVRAIFLENNKFYPQSFLEECLYKIQNCYIMIKFTFLKEWLLIKHCIKRV